MKNKVIKKYIIYIFIFILIIGIIVYLWNQNNVEGSEENMVYVSSKGILQSCDIIPTDITSSTKNVTIDYSKIRDGSVVYIHGSAIPEFSKNLNKLQHKIILVSGDSDESIPDMVFDTKNDFKNFIESDKIIHWFSQNAIITHDKLTQIPIGLDYHTLANVSNHSWGSQQPPSEQEEILMNLKKNSVSFENREIKCYSNFHFNTSSSKFGYDRTDAINKIDKELMFYEPSQILRTESWKNQTKYAFVVSPHGNGLDCHRTWEALVLGCIPIVKTSPLDLLFDNLPVLIVNDWSDVTRELLEKTVDIFSSREFNYDKLHLKYWMNIIRTSR
jgi:hypothetical protein